MPEGIFAPRRAVALLDPAIATRNAGDEIISQAARRWIQHALPDHFLATVPTHERMGIRSHRLIRQAEHAIVGGSNLLTSHLLFDRGWRVGFRDMALVNKLVLLGAGWRGYESDPSPMTKLMLRRLLSRDALHSVRDTHTGEMLAKAGIENVVVTSCMTMWQLTPAHLAAIPREKARAVVTTFTMRQPSPDDLRILDLLTGLYETVYLWPQGIDDAGYVRGFAQGRAEILGPTLAAYDALLARDQPIDYVGNRLHGGIRALQKGQRAFILAIDNRATEIARDTGLPVIPRSAPNAEIAARISGIWDPGIRLPQAQIDAWLAQFAPAAAAPARSAPAGSGSARSAAGNPFRSRP
ncbi:polysaccharide pyruvyl transferase family protein [Thioclava atlantica]|uniref:Capsular exopolysaccharide biosynthesis protein (Wzm) n=1 Tax=Thioclava atlantica TaxID=1317124 RepID=A0A085TXX9_9RHOB|nr:polysaccharide pyruvyl transferase family protein [Thioclava atlantica]KFE35576.1 capsular exopolysaccharide biosynthesis protein (Wzm) [Thioclava atlantica]